MKSLADKVHKQEVPHTRSDMYFISWPHYSKNHPSLVTIDLVPIGMPLLLK